MSINNQPKRLPPLARSQTPFRGIVSLYCLYNTIYNIDFNLIIYWSSPGFEPGYQGPKVATLPLCYTPVTRVCNSLGRKGVGSTALKGLILSRIFSGMIIFLWKFRKIFNHKFFCADFLAQLAGADYWESSTAWKIWRQKICPENRTFSVDRIELSRSVKLLKCWKVSPKGQPTH